jgi:ketosteroid isomerase-like protein
VKILALAPFLWLFVGFGAGVPAQDTARSNASVVLPPELQRVLTEYEAAWRNKDADALVSLFTEDGFVLVPGRNTVRGRTAILELYKGWGGPLFLRANAFATDGNIGYIIGAYSHEQGAADDGKFTLTLKKAPSGRWLIFSDMDNGNHKAG